MVSPILISIAAFVGVAALVGGVAMLLRGNGESAVENRLSTLTGTGPAKSARNAIQDSLLMQPLDMRQSVLELFISRFGNLPVLFEQADTTLTVSRFLGISGAMAGLGFALPLLTGLHPGFAPAMSLGLGILPLFWLTFRRKRRLKKFAKQLSDALELIARALRAGHSLAAGFNLVADEMSAPISKEFGRVFEEQNLGIPMDESLDKMTERVPNVDLRFFATALILQKQTGGDLAEILDKIGYLIRERFKIWGQVQALTGEGRLSGVVLLALPPVLFLAVWRLNPDYVMPLFTDPMGRKMLAGGLIMQLLGAIVIRKIVNIKV